MARLLYCRHADCGDTYESVAGKIAEICPSCQRVAKWSTTPGQTIEAPTRSKRPRVPYDLNENDKRMLRAARIAVDPTF